MAIYKSDTSHQNLIRQLNVCSYVLMSCGQNPVRYNARNCNRKGRS